MGSLTNYGENVFVNHMCGTPYTPAATLYLGLSQADPTDDMSGWSECDYTSYARVAITFAAASARSVVQSALATFPQATGGDNNASHWAVFDALTNGNALAHGALGTVRNIVSGKTPKIAASEINITIGSGGFFTSAVNAMLDRIFRNQAYTISATYVGFVTTASSDSAAGTEVTGNNYSRVQVNAYTGGTPAWTDASGGAVSNNGDIDFPDPSGDWDTGGLVIYDAASSGNALMYKDGGTLVMTTASGDTVSIPSGDLDVAIS